MATALDDGGDYQERYPSYADTPDNRQPALPQQQPRLGAPSYKTPCKNPQGHDESDLCAQWRAANGAKQAARWGLWQFIASIFGIIGLGVTLWFNKRAIELALESGEDTERALKIAEDNATAAAETVAETRRIGEAQVRCYLTGISAELGFTLDGAAIVNCKIKNTGSSPARKLECTGHVALQANGEHQIFNQATGTHAGLRYDIGGGVEEELTFSVQGSMDGWEPGVGGMYYVSVGVKIVGKDVFGLAVSETERFVAFPAVLPEINSWIKMKRSAQFE